MYLTYISSWGNTDNSYNLATIALQNGSLPKLIRGVGKIKYIFQLNILKI